jgi:hypothetical protein
MDHFLRRNLENVAFSLVREFLSTKVKVERGKTKSPFSSPQIGVLPQRQED